MTWERTILKYRQSLGSLQEALAPVEFLDHCFLTRAGQVGLCLRLNPIPAECLDPERLDELCRQLEAAFRVLEPEVRVYQYLFKRETSIPRTPSDHPVLARTTAARLLYLEAERGPVFALDFIFALVYETPRSAKLPWIFDRAETEIEQQIRMDAHHLTLQAYSWIEGMRHCCQAGILSKGETFVFLRRLLNYRPDVADGRQLVRDWDLAWQLGDSAVECHGPLKVDRYTVRILTLKEPPQQTYADLLRDLLAIPCNTILAAEWKPLPVAETDKIIHHMRRHYNHVKSSITNYVGKNTRPGDILVDKGKQALIDQLGDALEDIQIRNVYFGEYSLTAALYHEDPGALRSAAAKANTAILPHGGAWVEHTDKGALAAWLAMVPGNAQYNLRRIRLSNVNYADLSLIYGPHQGAPENPFLQSESLAALTTPQKTIYHLNLHQGQLGHTLITGRPEAGKSYLMRFLAANIQKYHPYTVILDIARGFEHFTEDMGGSYVELGQADGATINPFALEPTTVNLDFLFSFVRVLLESDQGVPIDNADCLELYKKIQQLYRLPRRLRRLGNLALSRHLQERLARWTQEAEGQNARQFAYLFDNEHDHVTFAQFQAFNFPKLAKNPEALEALLYYVLHRSLDTINHKTDQRPSFVFIDEAWTFFRHPASRGYIELALKDWRKCNASIILATHTVADLEDSLFDAITTCCLTKIHGSNPGINTESWQKALRLNRTQAELITRLRPQGQFLLQDSGLIEILVDPHSHALYSNRGSL